MSVQGSILEYEGLIDYRVIDNLLRKVKRSKEFLSLDKLTGKRLYAILVECLENIVVHSAGLQEKSAGYPTRIRIHKTDDQVMIKAGNPVPNGQVDPVSAKIDLVNRKNEKALTKLYETIINKGPITNGKSAGLGFILMKLKSGNNINYRFIPVNETVSYFEIKIRLKKFIMRKLVIDQTGNSPRVILDPEKRFFEISGESRPPDVGSFYKEIITWMDDYSGHLMKTRESRDPIVFNFDFEYFNSSSAKYILDFCKQISSVRSRGTEIEVKWHYEEDDMDMLEVGREMSRMAKVPFEFVKKN